jgi:hypothetical protein
MLWRTPRVGDGDAMAATRPWLGLGQLRPPISADFQRFRAINFNAGAFGCLRHWSGQWLVGSAFGIASNDYSLRWLLARPIFFWF